MLEDGINLTTRPSDWFERTCGIRMWAHISALRSILKGQRGQGRKIGSQLRRTQYKIVSASVLFQKETQSMCTWLRTRFLNDERRSFNAVVHDGTDFRHTLDNPRWI